MRAVTIQTNLQIAGALLIGLGLAHGGFNRYFGWKAETAQLSLFTRQVFHVHCFFIALVLVLMGALSIFYSSELLRPDRLSHAVCGALAVFWIIRLAAQWFVYEGRIWRGSRFLTFMHGMFSLLWMYLSGTYSLAWLAN